MLASITDGFPSAASQNTATRCIAMPAEEPSTASIPEVNWFRADDKDTKETQSAPLLAHGLSIHQQHLHDLNDNQIHVDLASEEADKQDI